MLNSVKVVFSTIFRRFNSIGRPQKPLLLSMNYDEYWRVRGFTDSLHLRYQIMTEAIEPNSTVLDMGCGDGLFLEYLAKIKGISGYGVDVSQEAVNLARARGIEAEAADIQGWDIEREYDYIVLSEVLEHLAYPEDVIAKARKRFRKAILISVPNIGYYRHRLRLLFGRFPIQWGWHPAEHLRYWTVMDFIAWVSEFGLSVAAIRASTGTPVLCRCLPNLFGKQVVFVLRAGPTGGQDR